MRHLILAAAGLAALAAPAAAQQQIPESADANRVPEAVVPANPRDQEIARDVPDAREIEQMGEVAARAADAILDVPVGPLREAIEGRKLSRREREETLGDRAAKDDPYIRERMQDQMRTATVALGALTEQMAVMAPVLQRTLEDVERRMEDAVRGVPSRDYDRR
ncbi:MAG TPA: hypothetical protein VGD10_01800 [Allosphingosinicella sp.]|uniref:hypothetical protein n=1 Tax=Allosphingosinicella sp. TaxID=2823234 RepID=UPI002EDAF052